MARKAAPESHHLRPLRADDAAAVLRVFETSPGMDRQGEVRDLEAASAYVNLLSNGPEHRGWAIAGDDDALIGLVAIDVDESNRSGAVTYWMGEPDRGRGLTRRAVATIADWALSEDGLDLDRLDLEHVAGRPPRWQRRAGRRVPPGGHAARQAPRPGRRARGRPGLRQARGRPAAHRRAPGHAPGLRLRPAHTCIR